MGTHGSNAASPDSIKRDIFLSHRFVDKDFVRQLAADIEGQAFDNSSLLTWLDEAEISPGQSITGMVNQGLENSRFIALIMTPSYFDSDSSGWTDAEWHAALFTDPDNRKPRILPILAQDCPYIPVLLRHLRMIDLREKHYESGLRELLAVLRNEPLPRPIAHRGQLIHSNGKIDRVTLIAERAIPQADPDVINEKLYCNLLPIERLPQYVYTAAIAHTLRRIKPDGSESLPTKQDLKDQIYADQVEAEVERPFVPAFRVLGDRIVTFHDLQSPDSVFAPVIDDADVEEIPTSELLADEDDRKILTSLLNMAVNRHASRKGLVPDQTKPGRFFFPPKDGGTHQIRWMPTTRKASRTVAKSYLKDDRVLFWRHQGAYLKVIFLTNKFYLQIIPTWVITEDGQTVRQGPDVGALVINWTGPERNLQIFYHVRFWSTVLREKRGNHIQILAGEQWIDIFGMPAFVTQAYGIADDRENLSDALDQQATLIAEEEDEFADAIIEAELTKTEDDDDESELFLDDMNSEDFLDEE